MNKALNSKNPKDPIDIKSIFLHFYIKTLQQRKRILSSRTNVETKKVILRLRNHCSTGYDQIPVKFFR